MKIEAIKKIIDTTVPILGIMKSMSNSRLIESIDDGLDVSNIGGANVDIKKTEEPEKSKVGGIIVGIIYLLLIIYALYLHIQCKNRNFLGFIPAFCCPWAYLIFYATTYNLFPFVCSQNVPIPTATE